MTRGKEILKVADLARLELNDTEKEKLGREFDKITAYFTQLHKIELGGEMNLGYPCPRAPDSPMDYEIKIEELTSNLKNGHFRTPPWLV